MEFICFLLVTLFAFCVPMIALKFGKTWLISLMPIYLITGNVFAESFLTVFGALTSLAVPVYAATFLITDMLAEHYGKSDAKKAVLLGFIGQVLFLLMTIAVINAPIFPDKAQTLKATFGVLPRLILGSFIAYLFSQFWDVYIYHGLKERAGGGKRLLWLRNNISTITSQALDSTIFILIAFYGRLDNIWIFILTTWIFKLFAAFIDTPFLYLSYRILGKRG